MRIFGFEIVRTRKPNPLGFLKTEKDYKDFIAFLSDQSQKADVGLKLEHRILKNLADYMLISKESYEDICKKSFEELDEELKTEGNK